MMLHASVVDTGDSMMAMFLGPLGSNVPEIPGGVALCSVWLLGA